MPPLQRRDGSSRFVLGCVALFTLPFFIAGVATLTKGIAGLQRGERQSAAMLMLVGLVFTLISVGFFAVAALGLRSAARNAVLRSQHPGQPWLWRDDWAARRIEERRGAKLAVLWAATILWNAISSPLVIVFRREWEKGNAAILLGLLFPLIGAMMLIGAIYGTLRRLRFGASVCTIDQLPISAGGRCSGAISLRGEPVTESLFQLTLSTVRREITGSGKSRSTNETILWQEQKSVPGGAVMRAADGLRLPFQFDLPPDARSTDLRHPNDQIVWRLDAGADLPGVDYAASFELPVFATGTSTTNSEAVAAYHVEQRATAARRPLSDDSAIETRPLAEGGVEFQIPPRRDFGTAGFFLLFLAIWSGGIAAMLHFKAPIFFPVLFIALELLVIWMAIDFLFRRGVVRANRAGVEFRRGFSSSGRMKVVPAADVESIDAANTGQTNNRPLWDVQARLKNGKKRTVANYIRSSDDASTIAARLWQALGRD
jgi:hypothetical protein